MPTPKKNRLPNLPKNIHELTPDITNSALGMYLTEKCVSALTATSKSGNSLFNPNRLQILANKLLLHVMHGDQDKAEKILRRYPELLKMTATATDYSGRTFTTTAFRYALWALDTHYMCNMMLDCLPDSKENKDIIQALLTQFDEHTQNGVVYTLNDETIHEKHYDFDPLMEALAKYLRLFLTFNAMNAADVSQELIDLWCTDVSFAQSNVPAHIAQHYCDRNESFFPTPGFKKQTFVRFLEFLHQGEDTMKNWFSPDNDAGICRGQFSVALNGDEGDIRPEDIRIDLAALDALRTVRTNDLGLLRARLQKPLLDSSLAACSSSSRP